jgi:biopolymer transport protein TolR
MAFSASSSIQSCEINVTPLIDVLLVMLIIFMVISPSPSRGLDSSIPQGDVSSAAVPPRMIVRLLAGEPGGPVRYQVGEQGRVENVAHEALALRLRSLFASGHQRTLVVEADRGLSYEKVAEVVSLAREEGAGAVELNGLDGR